MKGLFSKKKLWNFFLSYSWIWALSSLVLCFGLAYSVHAINDFKDFETFTYFFETYEDKGEEWGQLTQKACPEILKVDVYDVSPSEIGKTERFAAFGSYADCLILLESDLSEMREVIQSELHPYSEEEQCIFQTAVPLEAYSCYGKTFAFKVHDGSDPSYNANYRFEEFFDFGSKEESFYLCSSSSSVHFGEKTDYGCRILSAILQEMSR